MKTVYLVPHSHYDVVWAFNKDDYAFINEHILDKAVGMINKDGFRFLIEQAYPLERMEEKNPELYKKVKKAIEEDKIEVVDGSYIMPDLMIPGGETLIREIVVGKKYVQKTCGKDVPVAYAADSFGLNAQMPQIYKKSGYKWLVLRRGLPRLIGRRVSEFLWEGLDGTRITTHWMPLGYRAGLDIDNWQESISKLSKLATTNVMYMPCGSGGVPPQLETPEYVDKWNKSHDDCKIIIATPGEFFRHFDKEDKKLPLFSGELYSADLEDVFPDVVSSRISLKLAIKEAENKLLLAEKLSVLAYIEGMAYPDEDIKSMWKKMLFLANHDVLPSCGIDEIYDEAWAYIGEITSQAKIIIEHAANKIVKEDGETEQLYTTAVFNPYNWQVTDWVEKEFRFDEPIDSEPGIYFHGEEIPSEIIEKDEDRKGRIERARLGFMATVRPMNHNIYEMHPKSETFINTITVADKNRIHTPFFYLEVDENTGILTVEDLKGRKLVKGNEVIIDEELGDLYFHSQNLDGPIAAEGGGGVKFGAFKPESLEIDQGALRTTITYKTAYFCLRWPYYLTEKFGSMLYRQKTLDLTKKIIIYEDIPRIDFVTNIDLKQSHVRLRLKFDTNMVIPRYTRQTQFGALEIPEAKIYEQGANVPAPAWLTAEEDGRGVAFLTPGVPVNEIRAGEIYYTLLRSVSVLSADGISGPLIPTPGAMELGPHTYTYSIYPYNGSWQDNDIYQSAYEFGQSLIPVNVDSAVNIEYQSFSIEPSNLIISSLKKAEDEDSIILRFFETEGQICEAQIALPKKFGKAFLTDLMENDQREIKIENHTISLKVNPFDIMTIKLKLK